MFDAFYAAQDGKALAFGTHCQYQDIGMFEMCGGLGYDYVWIDVEHGSLSLNDINNGIVGANAGGAATVARLAGHTQQDVKPILDMGIQGVVFPMINTAEEAEEAVRLCQYPPKGNRGFNPLRSMQYQQESLDSYLQHADRDILRMLQCEHYLSVQNLDEILEVKDISCIIVGPMDLSASVGKLGKLADPELLGYYQTIAKKCREKHVPFGTSIPYIPEFMKMWIDLGASYISVGNVYSYFSTMSKKVIAEARAMKDKA